MKLVLTGLIRTFLLGFFTLIPSVFTIWFLWFLLTGIDHLFKQLFLLFIHEDSYFPGLGLLVAIAISFGVGIAMKASVLRSMVGFLERVLCSIPLIKTIYGAFKDFSDYFSGQKKEKTSRMVMVRVPNSEFRMLGMVTQEHPDNDLGKSVSDKVLVYFPMSYQVGGYMLLVDKSAIEPLALPVEGAMRYILTAGISHAKRPNKV